MKKTLIALVASVGLLAGAGCPISEKTIESEKTAIEGEIICSVYQETKDITAYWLIDNENYNHCAAVRGKNENLFAEGDNVRLNVGGESISNICLTVTGVDGNKRKVKLECYPFLSQEK